MRTGTLTLPTLPTLPSPSNNLTSFKDLNSKDPANNKLTVVLSRREKNMNWEREAAIYRSVWYLNEAERAELDTHVALRTSLLAFGDSMYEDEEDHLKDKITIGIVTYEICYLNTSATELEEAFTAKEDKELIISLRVINSRNFAVCLIQPKWEALSREKYLSYREVLY